LVVSSLWWFTNKGKIQIDIHSDTIKMSDGATYTISSGKLTLVYGFYYSDITKIMVGKYNISKKKMYWDIDLLDCPQTSGLKNILTKATISTMFTKK
jgi:hypothetical protein